MSVRLSSAVRDEDVSCSCGFKVIQFVPSSNGKYRWLALKSKASDSWASSSSISSCSVRGGPPACAPPLFDGGAPVAAPVVRDEGDAPAPLVGDAVSGAGAAWGMVVDTVTTSEGGLPLQRALIWGGRLNL